MNLTALILLGLFVVKGYGQFRCYYCNDCKEFVANENFLDKCPRDEKPEPTGESTPQSSSGTTTATTTTATTTITTTTPVTGTSATTSKKSTTLETTESTSEPAIVTTTSTSESATGSTTGSEENEGTTTEELPEYNSHIRHRRSIREDEKVSHCFKIEMKDGDKYKTERGCVVVEKGKDPCEYLKDKIGHDADPRECHICEGDGCNGGTTIYISLFLLVSLILVIFFF